MHFEHIHPPLETNFIYKNIQSHLVKLKIYYFNVFQKSEKK